MTSRIDPPAAKAWDFFFRKLALAAVALLIALLFFQTPESPGGEGNPSYRMLLDIAYRPSPPATMSTHTLDGPLAPLQRPVYVGRSIWRSMTWQIGANLLMAAIVAGAIFCLPSTRAWWAMAFFVVFGISDPSIAAWVTIFVLSRWGAGTDQWTIRILCGVGMGILASTSIAHFLLGAGMVVLPALQRDGGQQKRAAYSAAAFLVGVVGTWGLLEQSPLKLAHWLWFGLTGAWTPSSLLLPASATAAFGWVALATAAWISAVFLNRNALRPNHREWQSILLVTWGMFLAWKLVAVQPGGTPVLFFATVILGGFLLLPWTPRAAALVFIVGVIGAAVPDATLITDPAGRINRRLLQNLTELRHLGDLRDRLRQNFNGYGASFAMPRTRAALDGKSVGILGDHSMQAVLNDARVIPSASFGTQFVRDGVAATGNAQALLGPDAPTFALERSDRDSDLLPALRDGPAHLALYQGYDFIFNEQNLSLWKKKPARVQGGPNLIKEGTVRFGEKLTLPPTDDTWLELECSPNWIGLVVDQFKPLAEPFLRVVDSDGHQLRYTLAWRMARAGFLTRPFFRGDMDLLRFEEGETLPQLNELIVDPPATSWLWGPQIRYRLYQIPPVSSAHVVNLTASFKSQYAALDRLPTSISAPFTPTFGLVAAKPAIFMHPNSVLEMVVTTKEKVVQGSLGIAPGAYANTGPNVTDGVSFSIEFIPSSGPKVVLFRRDLDPVEVLDDRGPQSFAVALPPSSGGRLLFRTFNLPNKTSSFDWSYWREIELK